MERKQTFSAPEMMNDRIIKMVSSTTCFTNDYFFENVLKEGTEDMNSYPVNV